MSASSLAVAAWMRYVSGVDLSGGAIEVKDPLADRLAALWRDDPAETVAGFLALEQVFPAALRDDAGFARDLTTALAALCDKGAAQAVADA